MTERSRWLPGALGLGLVIGCGDGGGGSDCQPGTDFCLTPDGETSGDGDPGDGDPGDGDGVPGDGDGDGDGDPGDGDGDPGDGDPGDGDGDDAPDFDNDGLVDSEDNCPADPNPNQLDFDEDGLGNVCDVLFFTEVSGSLSTSMVLNAGLAGNCLIPMAWVVTDGEALVLLDDDELVASIQITLLDLDDVNESCALVAPLEITLGNSWINYNGDTFPVSSLIDHSPGMFDGTSSGPHPMVLATILEASVDGKPNPPIQLLVAGELPEFDMMVTDAGATGNLIWSDMGFVVTSADEFMLTNPFALAIQYQFMGLDGSLSLAY